MPTVSALVLKVAVPFIINEPVPSAVVPSLNDTVPVGVNPVTPVTVAVRVTDCPSVLVAGVSARAVALAAMVTVTVASAESLGMLLTSPL